MLTISIELFGIKRYKFEQKSPDTWVVWFDRPSSIQLLER